MSSMVRVAKLSEIPLGKGIEVAAGTRVVALFNVEGTIYAMDGLCPHSCGPLGKGTLRGMTVTCPWHGWQFNVTSGKHLQSQTIKNACFPVTIEGDEVYVTLM